MGDSRDPGPGENGLDLLGFAQGVGEESGDNTFFQALVDEVENHSGDFVLTGKDPLGSSEGGFHYEGVGPPENGFFGSEAAVNLEIPRIEERLSIGLTGHVEHGGPVNVARGEELEAERAHFQGFMEGMGIETLVGDVVAGLEEVGSGFGTENVLVASEVIGVGVGYEAVLP